MANKRRPCARTPRTLSLRCAGCGQKAAVLALVLLSCPSLLDETIDHKDIPSSLDRVSGPRQGLYDGWEGAACARGHGAPSGLRLRRARLQLRSLRPPFCLAASLSICRSRLTARQQRVADQCKQTNASRNADEWNVFACLGLVALHAYALAADVLSRSSRHCRCLLAFRSPLLSLRRSVRRRRCAY